jgi:hypothetical protein
MNQLVYSRRQTAIETPISQSRLDLVFYIGASSDARIRLALTKTKLTSKSVIITTREEGSADFKLRFSNYLKPRGLDNVVPLFGSRTPRLLHISEGPSALLEVCDCDHIFFEELDSRPVNAIKILSIVLTLAKLARSKGVTVTSGLFAETDAEAVVLEQIMIDSGIAKEHVIGGWLNGFQNQPIRYLRVPVSVLPCTDTDEVFKKFGDTSRLAVTYDFTKKGFHK